MDLTKDHGVHGEARRYLTLGKLGDRFTCGKTYTRKTHAVTGIMGAGGLMGARGEGGIRLEKDYKNQTSLQIVCV